LGPTKKGKRISLTGECPVRLIAGQAGSLPVAGREVGQGAQYE
jgi:hypothetical protein